MTFLNPLLLFAALGIGLPILAHLLNRYQVKQTDWAAMQFLNRSIRVRSRQLRLRDILLLLLRCLAVLFLVLAVTKPGVKDATGVAARLGERRAGMVVAVDASYSMQHSDGTATRFERALEKVREITAGTVPGAPVSLVLLGDEHCVVVRSMAYDAARFEALLEGLTVTSGALNMETVPGVLAGLAAELDAIQKEIYLVTDLQVTDWEAPAPWLLDGLKEMGAQAATFIVPVRGSPENLAITDFELFSGLLRKGTMARYRATVHNYSPDPVSDVRMTCLMDGVNVDSKVIPLIGGRSSQSVSFFVPFHNAGTVKLTAQLKKDALPLDDARRTVASVRKGVSVLCVEGKAYGNSLESYVVKAMRARGGGSRKEEFKARSVSWLSLPSQDLKTFDVVILSDVPEITAGLAQQLRDYVKAGNGLIWFGGDNTKTAVWNKRSAMKGGSLLPGVIGTVTGMSDAKGAGRPLDPILPAHPVCRPLRSLPKDLLSETRFHKLLAIEPLSSSTVVLNLSGSATPLLLEHSIGRGHVFMFATSANPAWNNMALTPAFPMLLQQMVTYLTGREFETSQSVGGSLLLSYPDRPDANDGVFETPSGDLIRVPVREHAGQYVAVLDQARESGFYVARVSVQAPGQPIAVNVDTQESDVRCLEIADAQASLDATGVTVTASPTEMIDAVRTGYEFWRALMIACLVVLVMESVLASGIVKRA
ncbi:MAG: VWA domain-containing protein [Verrucomicrobia bacterium]|jgi:hypothetical protein|nr:VWA domain-containing protein [Verrucomicrobiota bacterium]MBT7066636.1 VWA domain-containing protein [Verrucomicrobiota bacterium]MBT7700391.1 VWA domain-containing protein [Verrucomicrobiota bacterium]